MNNSLLLEAAMVVSKAEGVRPSYVLTFYGESEIYSLARLYNRQKEFDVESARENW